MLMGSLKNIIKKNESLNKLSIRGGFNGFWGPFVIDKDSEV